MKRRLKKEKKKIQKRLVNMFPCQTVETCCDWVTHAQRSVESVYTQTQTGMRNAEGGC